MNVVEFVQKYIKTKVDYDGAFGVTCVDLFRQYCKEVLEIPHTGAVDGAKDLFLNYDKMPLEKTYFKKFYGSSNIKIGDVAIWNKKETNAYGHVAIVLGKLGNDLVIFEQDGFKQNDAKLTTRSTTGLLGYLRKK